MMDAANDNRPAGFDEALLAARPVTVGYARRLTRDHQRAEELVQDTMQRALAAADTFKPGSCMAAWLTVVCRNILFTELRRAKRDPLDREVLAEDISAASPFEQDGRDDLAAVIHALDTMPVEYSSALLRVAVDDTPYEQVAREHGVPLGTVKSRVHRAREILKAAA